MMESVLKLLVLSCMMSLVLGGTCPDYWMTYQGHCYRLYRSTVTWSTAKIRCEQNSAYLVSINSRSENDFVGFLAAGLRDNPHGVRTWLGLGPNYHTQQTKRWLDGNAMTYHNWFAGEPNNAGRNEGCIETHYSIFDKWNDAPCGLQKQYICEKDANILC